ncbi:putative quinol monooxygenase [Enterococcus faecalis]|nr:antibiotic biosynthesis monooxygenase [Enterococcus faecalis]
MVNRLPEGNVVVNIDFTVKKGMEEEFLNLVYYLIDNSVKEEGNLSYRVFKEERNTDSYVVIEHWESQSVLNRHLNMPHTVHYNENINKYLIGLPNRVELTRDNDSVE